MDIKKSIDTFSKLGYELLNLANNIDNSPYTPLVEKAINQNQWFTPETVKLALSSLGNSLQYEKLTKWISSYNILPAKTKTIGIVMAGNIPLVGFHDLLCALISGHNVLAKLSTKDQVLYAILKQMLTKLDVAFESRIEFIDGTLKNIDAIIATGSDNSSRYFEYYFNKYPHIIRKNRNSLAILTGEENDNDLFNLGRDIFSYFGLGCRNVSYLLVPKKYNFDNFFIALDLYKNIGNHNKYANNYDYNKAIFAMNKVAFFDNGFILVREDTSLASPIGVLHYSTYNSENELESYIEANKHKIQCVVSKTNWSFHTYGLGEAQQPELWDYADNVDTLEFLLNLK